MNAGDASMPVTQTQPVTQADEFAGEAVTVIQADRDAAAHWKGIWGAFADRLPVADLAYALARHRLATAISPSVASNATTPAPPQEWIDAAHAVGERFMQATAEMPGREAVARVVGDCCMDGEASFLDAADAIIALFPAQPAPVSSGEDALREAEWRGERRAIARLVNVAGDIAWQAGVGGRETAGVIVSYLATSPEEIAPFVAGDLSLIDFAGDWMRGGCLSWHGADGRVWTPEAAAAAKVERDAALAAQERPA